MKPIDAVLLSNCHRATVRIETGNGPVWARIRPFEQDGERVVFAFMLHPAVAFAYEHGEELAPNQYIEFQD